MILGMATSRPQVNMRLSPEEKAQLDAEAEAQGVTVATLVYQRVFNKPDVVRRVGRPRKEKTDQPIEGLERLGMTG